MNRIFRHQTQPPAMILRYSCSLRPNGAMLGVRWLILVAFMFGTVVSSIGGTSSHGLAAIVKVFHAAPFSSDESHEHVHEDAGTGLMDQSAGSDHRHHGADHSHDKAHALPAGWSPAAPQLPGWWRRLPPWIEMVQASRLERPPKG